MSKHGKRNWGHLASQKFAAFIFASALLSATAFWLSVAQFSTLVMGVVGLYGAFVGGRAWSDSSAMKYGGQVPAAEVSTVKKLPVAAHEEEREID